ncbi:hypothetical protein EJ08DRAFT_259838 [Tothia fuscella]|uniref:LYR motif-containing protein Cup1-like N-terminal domain-containing protein n=1 Tax=Tothia fuscella TaxID=1048955 RepID=A0A9P4NQV5_9PEZI|nr:hypothetical protein EJ08DRAFT_259838 [Tothia fuscella]
MTLPTPSHEALHLLRALLRECTYLPDPASRICIKSQILNNFRSHREKHFDAPKHMKRARTSLNALKRVNEGELVPLNAVLRRTYGRIGPRRYELMRALLRRDADKMPSLQTIVDEAPQKLDLTTVEIPYIFDKPKVHSNNLIYNISPQLPRLVALANSQVTHSKFASGRFKDAKYKMPATNVWGRSMPRCRVRNSLKRWRAKLLAAILPPLPEKEWIRLQGLAHGTVKWEGGVPRRKSALARPEHLTKRELGTVMRVDLRPHGMVRGTALGGTVLSTSQQSKIRGFNRTGPGDVEAWMAQPDSIASVKQDLLLDEVSLIRPLERARPLTNPHRITPRGMRRLWITIFQTCPMVKENEQEQWRVEWGASPSNTNTPETSQPFAALFDYNVAPLDVHKAADGGSRRGTKRGTMRESKTTRLSSMGKEEALFDEELRVDAEQWNDSTLALSSTALIPHHINDIGDSSGRVCRFKYCSFNCQ